MSSYKQILKQIANMEQRLCIDDPCEILDDILKIAKEPFLLEKEKAKKWNNACMARYRESHREYFREYSRNYYHNVRKHKQKDVK